MKISQNAKTKISGENLLAYRMHLAAMHHGLLQCRIVRGYYIVILSTGQLGSGRELANDLTEQKWSKINK